VTQISPGKSRAGGLPAGLKVEKRRRVQAIAGKRDIRLFTLAQSIALWIFVSFANMDRQLKVAQYFL
jgi:hypothetical protein